MRCAFARASQVRLVQSEWRVLAAVVALTASWSKLEDEAFVAQIAATAKVGQSTCRRALKRLNELGIIAYSGRRGPGQKPLVSLSVQLGEQSESVQQDERLAAEKLADREVSQNRSPSRATTEKGFREEDLSSLERAISRARAGST